MLKQRIVTGVVLVLLVLGAILLLPQFWFLLCIAAVICQGAWEWSRLAGIRSLSMQLFYVAVLALAMVGLYRQDSGQREIFLLAGCVWWIFAYYLIRRYPALGAHWQHPLLLSVTGMLVLLPGWSAMVQLRAAADHVALILLLLTLVAAADIGAYFSGRAFGKHKLAPQVSPNKTWEGFAGGTALCCAMALMVLLLSGVVSQPKLVQVLLVGAAALSVAIFSVVGDLFESLIKRQAGVKDSGALLPGHGGVLDRIDSITAALPLYVLALKLVPLS